MFINEQQLEGEVHQTLAGHHRPYRVLHGTRFENAEIPSNGIC